MEEMQYIIYSAVMIVALAIIIYLLEKRTDDDLFEKRMRIASVPMLLVIGLFVLVLWATLAFITPYSIGEMQFLLLGVIVLWGLVSLSIRQDEVERDSDEGETAEQT